jgi:hypothetical protein
MTTETKNKTHPEKDNWMFRVLSAKVYLPKNYMPLFVHYFPEYRTDDDKQKVRQVANLRKFDANIVTKIEQLAEIIKNS